MAAKSLSLTRRQKLEVFELLEDWRNSSKLLSKRDHTKPVPSSVLSLVINVSVLAYDKHQNPEEQKAYVMKLLKQLPQINIAGLNQGATRDFAHFIQHLLNDKQVWSLSYEQYLFFLYWLRRLV